MRRSYSRESCTAPCTSIGLLGRLEPEPGEGDVAGGAPVEGECVGRTCTSEGSLRVLPFGVKKTEMQRAQRLPFHIG